MSLRVSLTGRLKVETDRRVLHATRLPGRQGRVVLAYLLAEHDRPVPSEQLAEALWGPAPPPTWQPALRGVVSKVRGFLEALDLPADEMLTSSSGAYLLTLPHGATVDVDLAAGEVDAAERALVAGDLRMALAAAATARDIAGRPLLPGLEGLWLERQRTALQGVLTRSLEVLVDAHLATDHGELAVQPAKELVGLEPFRESAHLRLLRAHAAGGDRAEALLAYARCRRLLAEELGVDPSPELEAAYIELLRHDTTARQVRQPLSEEPVPTAHRAGDRGLFVGRAPELARLRAAWMDVRAGRRRLVLVAGEAGIGKTRLAAELVKLAERERATVLSARCDERSGLSYLPLRAALGRYLTAYPPGRLQTLIGPQGGELVRLWPELARRLPDLLDPAPGTPEAERYLLFQAVTALLDAIAADGPILLVIDDLHVADGPTLALLRHLAHASRPGHLLILGTYCDDEPPRADLTGALTDLLSLPGTEQMTLAGLAVSEVAAMAEAAVGRPLGPAGPMLAQALHGRTGGNPFYVDELLQHLADTAALAGADLARAATGPIMNDVPDGIRLVVGRRLARLGGQVQHVLDLAAVIGREADLAVLARVVDLGYDDLLSAVDTAVQAKLLDEQPGVPARYAFHHAIVHEHVYTSLPAARRALLHHRVGETLERLGGGTAHLGTLADHFALGQEGDAAKAADYAQGAGDQALAQLLYEEAGYRYRQALAALDQGGSGDDGRRSDLLLALGETWSKAGQPARATDAYLQAAAAATAAGSAERLARAALAVGGMLSFWSLQLDPATALALLREALAALGRRDSGLRALLLARLGGWLAVSAGLGAAEQHEPPHFGEAVAMARRLEDPGILAAVLADQAHATAGVVLGRPTGPSQALETTAELLTLSGRLGDDRLMYAASLPRAEALLAAGDTDGVDRLIGAEERAADRQGVPYHRWLTLALQAMRAIMRGEFPAGERLTEQALAYGRDMLGEGASLAHGAQLVVLRWLQGRLDEAQAIVERLAREPLQQGWGRLLPLTYPGQRRRAEARRDLGAAVAQRFADWRSGVEVVGLVGACALLGDRSGAAMLGELLLPYEGCHLTAGAMVYLGAGDHHLGILAATAGRFDDAERHLLAALAAHRRLGAPPWVALTTQVYAGMLRGRGQPGDHHRADSLDATAREHAAALGMELPGWGRPVLGPLT
jgi:DNA-binding SARP family transcriptional activator/tetratricopeptide (TPR) repeat protein